MFTPIHNLANVPDPPLIAKAITFARAHSSDSTYNHVLRSVFFGFIIADKILPDRDREAHAIASILHDLGFPLGHPPHSTIISPNKRFEVDGANAAREFLKQEASVEEWDKHRLQLKELEVQACAYGIWADFRGPDCVPGNLLGWDEYKQVVKAYPRLRLMGELKANMCRLCETKPQTTYDNTVGEWRDKYVEGYDRKGKLTQDLLETCDLDDIGTK
ncbi:hypothetical protein CC80DRAFT_591338 [Byssothecium circinans]|uniref:HD domain-containing protein n=1 Tax=Byssothecium circinans TaxID=147558 RepID=A0A6A5U5P9_9PLEO|nr:hypothetical protein CC80DRAFT_591338 [Byssothecium circinans]